MNEKEELKAKLSNIYKDVLTTKEMTEKFEVHFFALGEVFVTDRKTKEQGRLAFTHLPRLYYDFRKDTNELNHVKKDQ